MGAWGLGSDENDPTYDSVGFGIFERLQGVALTEEGKVSLTAELQAERPAALNEPGVVVLLIKLGCALDQKRCRKPGQVFRRPGHSHLLTRLYI